MHLGCSIHPTHHKHGRNLRFTALLFISPCLLLFLCWLITYFRPIEHVLILLSVFPPSRYNRVLQSSPTGAINQRVFWPTSKTTAFTWDIYLVGQKTRWIMALVGLDWSTLLYNDRSLKAWMLFFVPSLMCTGENSICSEQSRWRCLVCLGCTEVLTTFTQEASRERFQGWRASAAGTTPLAFREYQQCGY